MQTNITNNNHTLIPPTPMPSPQQTPPPPQLPLLPPPQHFFKDKIQRILLLTQAHSISPKSNLAFPGRRLSRQQRMRLTVTNSYLV
ncbi:hypothetical protein E2C01_048633 [Portunus trituberculatus]|uniref:Uncharacterized protein n=1 Tax=Portunus trituberculatus TaxID=210409 RepID=A0A5B7GC57_PORTR|nr:hypothetical protein [Portunus trituberculatus]